MVRLLSAFAAPLQEADELMPPMLASALERAQNELLELVVLLPLFAVALALMILVWIVGHWLSSWEAPYRRLGEKPFVQNLARQAVHTAVVLTGILLALEILGATSLVGAVLGTAGIMGLALGFAFRDIGENYLAGVILSLRQPFAPNDHVVLEGQEGKVVRLTARETILMTLDGNHLRIPNATVFRSVILNYSRNPLRRFAVELSVGPDEDLVLAQDTGREMLVEMPGVLDEPPPAARIVEVGDSWVLLRFLGWVDQTRADYGKVRSEAIRLIKERLEAEGVAMPPPEYRVRTGALEGEAPEGSEGQRKASAADEDHEDRERRAPGRPSAGAEPAPSGSRTPTPEELAPDTAVDEQIERDRRLSAERDLLEPDPG